jgi:chromosome segregation ATPase
MRSLMLLTANGEQTDCGKRWSGAARLQHLSPTMLRGLPRRGQLNRTKSMEVLMSSQVLQTVRTAVAILTAAEPDLTKLDKLNDDISAAQAELADWQAKITAAKGDHDSITEKHRTEITKLCEVIDPLKAILAETKAELESARLGLEEVRAQTNTAQLRHDQVLDSLGSLRARLSA